ncbi:hypothetical protein N0V90_002758 [Kalmusia sp. IMI 367209]|nr:hypothetical protein N0V90_002758 [Kalmusia sp. IMI 367209]
MPSPAKRRKKNDGSSQPVRSLDYFFSKQKQDATNPPNVPEVEDSGAEFMANEIQDTSTLTDEELAWKLQAEWNEQDQRASAKAPRSNDLYADPEKPATNGDSGEDVHTSTEPEVGKPLATRPTLEASKNTLSLQSAAAAEDTTSANIPFDQSPLEFDPAAYISELQTHWAAEREDMRRDPGSLLPAVWLATNAISPPYIDRELGLGGSAISKALKKVCGLDNAGLKTLYNKYGDPGDVAFEAKKRQSFTLRKPKPLTIRSVFDSLTKIANSKGHGSVEAKQRLVERLVQDARGAEESRYIVRTLVQHLRIGAVKTTMLIALSRAFMLSKPVDAEFEPRDRTALLKLKKEDLAELYSKNEEIVKACFARRPNYNDLIPSLLEIGGRDFSCEYKYDGQRAQVHCDEKGKVTIFSRHLEVMTDKYPDLVALVPQIRGEGVSSFILEGEVVAIDREKGELKTFQTLSNRARKDVVIGSVTIDVCLFAFDLMYLNGEELLNRPFRERRNLLRSLFVEMPHHFTWVKSLDATSADVETVQAFFKSATDIKCEGIMVKVLDNLPNPDLQVDIDIPLDAPLEPPTPKKKGRTKPKSKSITTTDATLEGDPPKTRRKALLSTYEPDKRLDSWLKVKKDYNTTSETLDLIPIAAFHGSGRKAAWWSPILLAIRNAETGQLEAVTKCMSGFTDAFYKANRARYDKDDPENTNYGGGAGTPDVWFEPSEVWEVAFADLTLSPTYTAAIGLVSEERGLSTRFPRFLKVREDKGIDEATEAGELADLYRKQEARVPKESKAVEADEGDE